MTRTEGHERESAGGNDRQVVTLPEHPASVEEDELAEEVTQSYNVVSPRHLVDLELALAHIGGNRAV